MNSAHSSSETGSSGLIKTPKQLILVVVLAFVLPILGIFAIIHFVVGGKPPVASPMSEKAIAERIAPIGSTPEIDKAPSTLTPAPTTSSPMPAVAMNATESANNTKTPAPMAVASSGNGSGSALEHGKAVFNGNCQACHATGAAGAPKLGDKAAWGPRISKGIAALQMSAIKGKNVMPAKGGNLSLSDNDVKAAVDYMVSQAK